MTPERIEPCDRTGARRRLLDARAQLELAESAGATGSREGRRAAASCAVLAGIAAADAICCAELGERSRSQDHRAATALLARVRGAEDAARHLARLLSLKDRAQYGFDDVGGTQLTAAVRHAQHLVETAAEILAR